MLRVDLVDDIADDSGVDTDIISERDIRVEHHDFNLVDNARITHESPTSSHATEADGPCP